jgi:hypothetical protein
MSPKDIKVGKTYYNRGQGKTTRTVLEIADKHRPEYWYGERAPTDPGVLYKQGSRERTLYLSSFAKWAGGVSSEVVTS